MCPRYAQGEECSIKFATTYAKRDRFIAACSKIGATQVEVLTAILDAWCAEIDGADEGGPRDG